MAGLLPSLLVFSYATRFYDLAVLSPAAAGCSKPAVSAATAAAGVVGAAAMARPNAVPLFGHSSRGLGRYIVAAAKRHAAACGAEELLPQQQQWMAWKKLLYCPMANSCWKHVFSVDDSTKCLSQSDINQVAGPVPGSSCTAAGYTGLDSDGKRTTMELHQF